MKKLILTLFAAASLSLAAQETTTTFVSNYNRTSISYNHTNLKSKPENETLSLNGFGLEYIHGFSLSKSTPLYLEAGLKAIFSFGKETGAIEGSSAKVDLKYSFLSFEVPVNLTYIFNLSPEVSIAPYAGINFKLHALGKVKAEKLGESADLNLFDKDEMGGYPWNRFQMGWQAGVGAYYSDFYLGIGYGTDFIKIYDEDGDKINSSHLSVSLGYTF